MHSKVLICLEARKEGSWGEKNSELSSPPERRAIDVYALSDFTFFYLWLRRPWLKERGIA